MPNNGRITVCPYYRDEKNLSISCEDTFRRFRWPAQKKKWMDEYCDKNWRGCPFAKELNALYEGGNMDKTAELKHKCKELEKELRKTASMLGRREKADKEKADQIRDLQKKNRYLIDQHQRYAQEIKEAKEASEKVERALHGIADSYEVRLAYLMSEFADGVLDEAKMTEWAKTHEYAIVAESANEDAAGRVTARYRAEVREFKSEDGSGGPAAEAAETGGAAVRGKTKAKEVSQQPL